MATPIASSVLGVAGFDTKAAVTALLAFDQLAINQVQKKQTIQTQKQDAFAVINDAMLAFKSTALSMADSSKFFAYSAALTSNSTVPSSTLLDVNGTNSVSAGSHKIIVQQVAQAQRLSSGQGVSASFGTSVFNSQNVLNMVGSFSIGTTVVSIVGTDTLQDVASKINQKNTGSQATGVSASIIKVGNNDFRLVLASDKTGIDGFSLTGAALDAGGALANLQLGNAGQINARNAIQSGLDAKVSIDGLSIFRSNNTISDVLNGVTLTLKQANTAEISMNISVDTTSLRNNVRSFVDAYNKVQSLVNSQFALDPKTGTTGILASESVLTSIQSTLSSSLLQSIPGLASDRNTMVSVGIEPDAKGVLRINPTLFDKFITTDPTAIRDVFVANGSSSNQQIQFLTNGLNTPSGNYKINVLQAASRASVNGTANLVTNTLGSSEVVTFTTATSKASVNLTAGMNQSSVITALNSEFSKQTADVHQLSGSLGVGLTNSTALSSLGFNIVAGDSINISGSDRLGRSVSGSFSVLNPAVDTISTLLSAIQSTFNQQVTASLDTVGKIRISDVQTGNSLLSVQLSTGLGTLNLGTDTVLTEGRYAMNITAISQGNGVSIQGKSFGTSSDFSINQTVNGLGIANQNAKGQRVQGTINGISAMGSGQLLMGQIGNIDGLGVLYTGSTVGNVGSVNVSVGLGAKMEGLLNLFANPFTGLIQSNVSSSQSTFDALTTRIADMERQMRQKKTSLQKSFLSMQNSLSVLNQAGSFLTQLNGVQNAQRA